MPDLCHLAAQAGSTHRRVHQRARRHSCSTRATRHLGRRPVPRPRPAARAIMPALECSPVSNSRRPFGPDAASGERVSGQSASSHRRRTTPPARWSGTPLKPGWAYISSGDLVAGRRRARRADPHRRGSRGRQLHQRRRRRRNNPLPAQRDGPVDPRVVPAASGRPTGAARATYDALLQAAGGRIDAPARARLPRRPALLQPAEHAGARFARHSARRASRRRTTRRG